MELIDLGAKNYFFVYSLGGSAFWQFLLSRWRYAVHCEAGNVTRILNCYASDAFLKLKMRQNSFSAGAMYHTPKWELMMLPQTS